MTERIRPTDTAGDLLGRLAEGGAELLVRTLDGIADGSLEARDQPGEGLSLAPKILVEHAEIDWTDTAVRIDRQIRACTPGPGAWSTWEGERFKIGAVTSRHRSSNASSPVSSRSPRTPSSSAPRPTPVELGEVKAFGKKQMRAADWARGVTVPAGRAAGPSPVGVTSVTFQRVSR